MLDGVGFGAALGSAPRLPSLLQLVMDGDADAADRLLSVNATSSPAPSRQTGVKGENVPESINAKPETASKEEPVFGRRPTWTAAAERPILRASAPQVASTPAAVIDRIANAVPLVQARGTARIRIMLNPAHLGELLIDLRMGGSLLHGKVQAGSEAARDLILTHLDELRHALEQQGIQVGDFQVSVDSSFRQEQSGSSDQAVWSSGEDPSPEAMERPRSIRPQALDVLA